MIDFKKVGKLAMVASLFVASAPCAYAMIQEEESVEAIMARFKALEKEEKENIKKVAKFEAKEKAKLAEEAALVKQVEEFEAREKAKLETKVQNDVTTMSREQLAQLSMSLIENFDNIPEEFIRAQAEAEANAKRLAEQKLAREIEEFEAREKAKAIVNSSAYDEGDALTEEQFAALLENMQNETLASQTIWTRDPGIKVQENHPQYRLRAENMPESQKNGGNSNAPTQGLGKFIQNLERDPNRDKIWEEKCAMNERQMKQREIIISSPSVNNKSAEQEAEQERLQAERLKHIQEIEGKAKIAAQAKAEALAKAEAEQERLQAERVRLIEALEAAKQQKK